MQRPSLFSFRTPIDVEVYGDELDETSAAAEKLEARLKTIPGLTDIKSSWEKGSPEAHVLFNRDQLSRYNLNLEDVANTLKNKVKGAVASEFRQGDDQIDIRVWDAAVSRSSIRDLQNMLVAQINGVQVPLSAVSTIGIGRGPNEIRRINQKRSIVLSPI